jgi:hypothetical protein
MALPGGTARTASATVGLALALSLWGLGCHNNDLVEAELRTRERELRQLRGELTSAEWANESLSRELQDFRHGTPTPPELASQTYAVRQIALGRQTGGYDREDKHGDDALQIVVEPRDGDGHVIKAPGALHVEALEITSQGVKLPLSTWDVSPAELRRSWKSGLFSTGYILVLPWQRWPTSDKVRVVVRLILPDGRLFEADKDVKIRLVPEAERHLPPVISEPLGPAVPGQPIPLPAPRKLEEGPGSKNQAWWMVPRKENLFVQASLKSASPHETSIADAVQLETPAPLTHEPGESDEP